MTNQITQWTEDDVFSKHEEARTKIRAILEKYGLSSRELKIVCRHCRDFNLAVMAERLSARFGFGPGEAERLCRLCREVEDLRVFEGLY